MATYDQEKHFFNMFVTEAEPAGLTPAERKLINLIRKHFDILAPLGTAGGKRADKFANLISNEWTTTSDILDRADGDKSSGLVNLKQLNDITIEEFRAFSNHEHIDLSKKYTFVYGPNGSGKSSFFEALEYCLIGDIQEANSRRQTTANYIRNLTTGKSKQPILRAIDQTDKVVVVAASRTDYQFCFIEKNRIENFARISSQTREKQVNLLATLFSLDSFNKFVEGFTDNITVRVDTEGRQAKELRDKEISIAADRKNKEVSEATLQDLTERKEKLVQEVGVAPNFDDLVKFINGDTISEGRVRQLENKLEKPVESDLEIESTEEIQKQLQALRETQQRYLHNKELLQSQSEKEAYLQLYQAVKVLEPQSLNRCPACQTPIGKSFLGWKQTKINPYEAARKGLEELRAIGLLKQDIKSLRKDLRDQITGLDTVLAKYTKSKSEIGILTHLPVFTQSNVDEDSDDAEIAKAMDEIVKFKSENEVALTDISKRVQLHNQNVKSTEQYRNELKREKVKLQNVQHQITVIETESTTSKQTLDKATSSIDKFELENADLLKRVEEEKRQVELNKQFVEAYQSLIPRLTEFKNELPARWTKDLNLLVKEIYNLINLHDPKSELIEEIKLPEKADAKALIAFQDNPRELVDALYILSEGHLRCLGLAILVAKNIAENKPIVIMDDIVNAIDDDHRSGIRRVIFEYDKFRDKQVVLTSHSENFIRETELDVAAKDYGDLVKKITFAPPRNRVLHLKENDAFNYLQKSKKSSESGNKKDALAYSRQALENLANLLWKKLARKKGKIELSVKIGAPDGHPQSIHVTRELCKYISENIVEEKFKKTEEILSWILGLETKSPVIWSLMNEGVHEGIERDDFNMEIVKELIGKLFLLDSLLKAKV